MTKPKFNVVGLDLSLTSTGVALSNGTHVIKGKGTGPGRLSGLRLDIMELVDSSGQNPLVVIEGYSFAQRNSNAHSMGELGGVIKLALYEEDIATVLVPPTVRAKFATGRGNASKSEVVSAVSARTKIVWEGPGADDQCDAWVLQEMGLTHLGASRYKWPAKNLEALESVEWPVG